MLTQLDVHMQNNAVGPHIQKLSWNGSFQVNVTAKTIQILYENIHKSFMWTLDYAVIS